MPRKVQDIMPNDRRSIRDIPVSEEKRASVSSASRSRTSNSRKSEEEREIPIHKTEKPVAIRRIPVTPPVTPIKPRRSSRRTNRLLIAVGIIVATVVIAFFASSSFSRASFTIVPKSISFTATGTYVAHGTPANGVLSYDLVTLKGTASTTIPATSGPSVSTKAQGTVTVYNAYSSQAVRLIAGTRISGTSGLIYRLTSSIVIPGYTKTNGTIIPGSIKTRIMADQPGDSYNISGSDSVSDFKIVAYKGTSKYDSIYARLASSVTGGFVGTKMIISPSAVASTTAALKASLTSSLISELTSAVPAGYVTYDDAYASSFSSSTMSGQTPNTAVVTVQGTVYGILFDKKVLTDALSQGKSAMAFGKSDYDAPNLQNLQLSIANLKDFSAEKKNSLIVNVKGNLTVVGSVPINEIKTKLEGKSLGSTQDIFKSYSNVIESGSGELVPPWAKIPTNPDRIMITVQKP